MYDNNWQNRQSGPDDQPTPDRPKSQGQSPGGKRVLAWVAMMLACILIGGSAGGLLVYGLMAGQV